MTVTVEPSITTGPIAGSSKAYREVAGPDGVTLRVPLRRVHLSTGADFDLYDTSGPYTDPNAVIDLAVGLPARPGLVATVAPSCSAPAPAKSPPRWPSSPPVRACPPSWCATRWPSAVR